MQSNQQTSLGERSIGAILIDAGRISSLEAEKILSEQKQHNLRFGDAALKLGMLNQDDIQFALARQFQYPYLSHGDQSISEEVVAAFSPFSSTVEQLRALRTQLMLRWFDAEAHRKSLAIVSAQRGEGRSYIAANLAVIFSQLGERTLLIDADLRNPRQHQLFKLSNSVGLSTVLAGRASANEAAVKIKKLLDLSVLPSGAIPPNPQELLSRDAFSVMLSEFSTTYDVIIVDTPDAGASADAQTISSRVGSSLVIASKNRTSVADFQSLAISLQNSNVTIVGSLLNDF